MAQYEPIRTALSEAYLGDTALARLLYSNPTTFDSRVIALLSGLGQNVDSPANTAITTADIKALFAALHATDNSQRIAKLQNLFPGPNAIESLRKTALDWTINLYYASTSVGASLDFSAFSLNAAVTAFGQTIDLAVDPIDSANICRCAYTDHSSTIPADVLATVLSVDPFYQSYSDAFALGPFTAELGPVLFLSPSARRIEVDTDNYPQSCDVLFTVVPLSEIDSSQTFTELEFDFSVPAADTTATMPRNIYFNFHVPSTHNGILLNLRSGVVGLNMSRYEYRIRMRRSGPTTTDWKVDLARIACARRYGISAYI